MSGAAVGARVCASTGDAKIKAIEACYASWPSIVSLRRLKSAERRADIAYMSQPIDVDLPHNLGKDEARRRIANNVHKLADHIPGGAQVQSGWAGDQLNLQITAMGESVNATIDVRTPRCTSGCFCRGMLGMFSGLIQAALQKKGNVLLEDHHKG